METTAEDRWQALAAAETANEPQWVVWPDAMGEAEWAIVELALFGLPVLAPA